MNVLFQKKTPGAETVQKFPHPIFFQSVYRML